MKEIIHHQETKSQGRFITPQIFESTIKNIEKVDFVEEDIENYSLPHEKVRESEYHLMKCLLKYHYSPGLGSFPNIREKIILYGDDEDRDNLKRLLKEKGLKLIIEHG